MHWPWLVCSDLHLDISRRLSDTVDALEQILRIAEQEKVSEIVVLGDVYTSRRPHSSERTAFDRWVNKARKLGSLVILEGNHDGYPNGITSFSEFTELPIDSVSVLKNPAVYKNVFLGHMLLREASLGPTEFRKQDAESLQSIVSKYPDCKAYLFGDVHKHQQLSENPLALYAGSIIRNDFGERNDPKGVVLFDPVSVTWKFVELVTREMVQVEIDATKDEQAESIKEKITQTIPPVVKIIIHGTEEQIRTKVNEPELRRVLEPLCYGLVVSYSIEGRVVARDERITESLSAEQALKAYLDKLSLGEEERAAIMEEGLRIMREVDE